MSIKKYDQLQYRNIKTYRERLQQEDRQRDRQEDRLQQAAERLQPEDSPDRQRNQDRPGRRDTRNLESEQRNLQEQRNLLIIHL